MDADLGSGQALSGYSKGYCASVDAIRNQEYPLMNDTTYLDHAGTTLYAKSTIEAFAGDMNSNIFGNPHSMSLSSQLSTQRTDDVRLRVLRFFNADPDEFDVVFVANATAAIKLVADAFRDFDNRGFQYGYHLDSHNSIVGVREVAHLGHQYFSCDTEVDMWISELASKQVKVPTLIAYPGQSNMNGRRLPLRWCNQIRYAARETGSRVFTLLDAASLVSTSPLDLSAVAPDFTAEAGHIFERRKYFGGGTVDMALATLQWHAKAEQSLHSRLEDGTIAFHNIIALNAAMDTHERLYRSMANISAHTACLAELLFERLSKLTHWNQRTVCQIYHSRSSTYGCTETQGPIIAFNLCNSQGEWIPKSEVEKLATVQNIQIRTGGVCNPGGVASALGWDGTELRNLYSKEELRCGDSNDIMAGRPTGILRVSLGAMTNMTDVESFANFVEDFYVEKSAPVVAVNPTLENPIDRHFYIESLAVFPIKSCGAFKIPEGKRWEVKPEGLAWDREWCLIHQGTGAALNQKRYPRMALIRPDVDLERGVLRIHCDGMKDSVSLEISLGWEQTGSLISTSMCPMSTKRSTVCGDQLALHAYASPVVSTFFSDFLGVPCTLARFPPQSANRYSRPSRSHSWKHKVRKIIMPGSFPPDLPPPVREQGRNPLLLANEMPILIVSRSSVNRLNENIKAKGRPISGSPKAVAADVFRSNIVVAERLTKLGDAEQPYAEDMWSSLQIGPEKLRVDVMGSCERCQMVCIDQLTGIRREEPFSTLAKTRTLDGKVLFGRYAALARAEIDAMEWEPPARRTVMVGDLVVPKYSET
ncbi:hypothetical protein N7468_006568 [Penicillium chermesinum]|uniref:Molybdenum cofactor sulfurase n=1 Tax=Penicillium chermesinum TaxID=63820 RepID=A0A9W9NSW4_9EURO|nr:uncharacterized protein N7468_006568 [Penicillium chermesinum]KAJ5225343.1 hypothetical protein N7468_006568 [Penicillium chermesinum]